MEPYVWYDRPVDLQSVLPGGLDQSFRPFAVVVGHTHFGDIFLENLESGEFAVTTQGTCTLFDSGYFDAQEFRTEYLQSAGIVEHLLRPADVEVLRQRLGDPGAGQVFYPTPIPALGGSNDLSTYNVGGLWEYLSFVIQTLGVTRDVRGT